MGPYFEPNYPKMPTKISPPHSGCTPPLRLVASRSCPRAVQFAQVVGRDSYLLAGQRRKHNGLPSVCFSLRTVCGFLANQFWTITKRPWIADVKVSFIFSRHAMFRKPRCQYHQVQTIPGMGSRSGWTVGLRYPSRTLRSRLQRKQRGLLWSQKVSKIRHSDAGHLQSSCRRK